MNPFTLRNLASGVAPRYGALDVRLWVTSPPHKRLKIEWSRPERLRRATHWYRICPAQPCCGNC